LNHLNRSHFAITSPDLISPTQVGLTFIGFPADDTGRKWGNTSMPRCSPSSAISFSKDGLAELPWFTSPGNWK